MLFQSYRWCELTIGGTKELKIKSIQNCLELDDPLAPEVFEFLLGYREEDSLVDFKETFDNSEREWMELTKDVMSFANSRGGYLVFGVKDGSFEKVGLDKEVAAVLINTNNILLKLNRFLDPEITSLRAKSIKLDDLIFAAWCIPESTGRTHIVSRDATFTYPSGDKRTVLRQGTIWVRRSAGNHLADAADIEALFLKRNEAYRESLLTKIARVVEAPAEHEVFILSPDPTDTEGKRFQITDSPDAIAVKGLSFTTTPTTPEEELAGLIALSKRTPHILPPPELLWRWYANRESLGFSSEQRLNLAEFCLLNEVPAFYWLQGLDAQSIKMMIKHAIISRISGIHLENLVRTAAFMGKRFHGSIVKQLGQRADRLAPRTRMYPDSGPLTFMGLSQVDARRPRISRDLTEKKFREQLLAELNSIAKNAENTGKQPKAIERSEAIALDCYLYSQDDKYAGKRNQK